MRPFRRRMLSRVSALPSGANLPTPYTDDGLIDALYDAIEQGSGATEPHRVLANHYETIGWDDAAAEQMREILALDPKDIGANEWLEARLYGDTTPRNEQPYKNHSPTKSKVPVNGAYDLDGLLTSSAGLTELHSGYSSLMQGSKALLMELAIYVEMCPDLNLTSHMADLKALAVGKTASVIKVMRPLSPKDVATRLQSADDAEDVAFRDLEAAVRWERSRNDQRDTDGIRDAVRKRADAIKTGLPSPQAYIIDTAFMHIEHEHLGKTYQNGSSTTMLGELISSVPREEFWVSEDGFAWDMSELAQAIEANGGVMRNPLSKQMFTAQDVKSIIRHKSGRHLAALQAHQQQLINGLRKDTIDKLESMAQVLLADMTENAAPSRGAVDEFLAFLATLPEIEQTALYDLRVPASDSHTGASFDISIGQAVDDAKANRQCFHKTGDHLFQAAQYLRKTSTSKAKMSGARKWFPTSS